MLLHLIRHAEADGAHEEHPGDHDPSLSPTGILQAGLLPAALAEWPAAQAREWLKSCPAEQRGIGAARLEAALRALLELSAERPVAVVTHAFVVGWMAARVLGASSSAWLRMPVDNASVATLGRNAVGEVVLHRFNWTPTVSVSAGDSPTSRPPGASSVTP